MSHVKPPYAARVIGTFVLNKLWFGQHVALIDQFLDADNAALTLTGMSVDLERRSECCRHVIDRVLASEKTYAAINKAVNSARITVVFK